MYHIIPKDRRILKGIISADSVTIFLTTERKIILSVCIYVYTYKAYFYAYVTVIFLHKISHKLDPDTDSCSRKSQWIPLNNLLHA